MLEDADKVKGTVPGDGASVPVADDALAAAKAEIKYIADNRNKNANSVEEQTEPDDVLLCRWNNQSADGLKHDTTEKEALPFDGALDTRVRYADMVLNEKVKLAVLALLKARVRITGIENGDNAYAAKLTTVARWLKDNQWGVDYIIEMAKWVRFAFGDRPAASLMEVHYRREQMIEMARMRMTELGAMYVQLVTDGMAPEQIAGMMDRLRSDFEGLQMLMMDPDGVLAEEPGKAIPDAADILRQFFPYVTDARAKQVVRSVREQAAAGVKDPIFEFPRPVVKEEGPVLVARRIFRDFFLPANTARFKTARCYYIREWLTEADLRKRIVTMDYDPEFVKEVLKQGDANNAGGFDLAGQSAFGEDRDAYRGLFEIITQYRVAVNDENISGVYVMTLHYSVDIPAGKEELLDYPHGGYPGVLMAREVLTDRVLDSRGIPDLAGPMQGCVKEFMDAAGDNAKLNTVPAFQTFGRRSSGRIRLGMLEENKMRRGGDIKPILVGQYPVSALKGARELIKMYNEYFGRPDAELAPQLSQIENEWLVLWVLGHASDVWKMALQYMQEYMPPEMMERIAGSKLGDAPKTREEIRGAFDIKLEFDGRDFDFEFIKAKAELFRNVLMPMDTKATGRWEEALKALFESVDPNLAERVVMPVDQAQKNETEDEAQNIIKISNGIPVPMVEAGQNFPLRAQLIEQWAQANLEDIQKWSPQKQKMLADRVKHLQFMTQQMRNAQTGRVGVQS